MNTTIIAPSRTAEDGEFPRFSFSFRIIFSAPLSRNKRQLVANHAIVLIKQTTLFALKMKHLLQLLAFQILMYY